MLTIAPGVDGSENYYSKDNYYTKEEGIEHSYWWGKGAEKLGLPVGQGIDPDLYHALWRGEVDNRRLGRVVNGQTQHRPGWDLTFSAPKSLSILSEIYGIAELRQLHEKAVQAALARLEGIVETRLTVGGVTRRVMTGNAVFACFTHDTSRNLDCQLHTHAFTLNMTWTQAGWRSIQEKRLLESQREFLGGMEYQAALAKLLKDAGYNLVTHPKDPRFFEIAGVPQPLIEACSTRSKQIEQWFKDHNVEYDPVLAKAVALITRSAKKTLPRDELRAMWLEIAKQHPFDLSAIRQTNSLSPAQPWPTPENEQRTVPADAPARGAVAPEAPVREEGRGRSGGRSIEPPGDGSGEQRAAGENNGVAPQGQPVNSNGTARPAEPPGTATPAAQTAVDHALRHLSEREMSYTKREIKNTALLFARGDLYAKDVDAEIKRRVQAQQLVLAPTHTDQHRKRDTYWTTPANKERERTLIELASRGKNVGKPLHDAAKVEKALAKTRLNENQRGAIVESATTQDRYHVWQGDPGVGKTTALYEFKKIMDKAGYEIIGLAPSYQSVAELSKSLGIKGMTVDRFVVDPTSEKMGRPFRKQIWIVDEDSMVSLDRQIDLMRLAEERGARILWAGDHQQLESVSSGRAFWQMQQTDLEVSKLKKWMRPKNDYMKEIFSSVLGRNYESAFATMRGRGNLIEIEKEFDALDQMALDWIGLSKEERTKTLVVTPTNEQAKGFNDRARDLLIQRNELEAKGERLTVFNDVYMTQEQIRFAGSYQKDNVVRFADEHLSVGKSRKDYILKNEYFSVIGVNKDTNIIALQSLKDKRKINLDPRRFGGHRAGGMQVFDQEKTEFSKGDRVRWVDNRNDHGLKRNDELTVVNVNAKKIKLQKADGQKIELGFGDFKNMHFVHDYAKTAYGVQGATHERVMTIMSSWRRNTVNAKSFMVALTRASHDARLYTDSAKGLLAALQGRQGHNTEALTGEELTQAVVAARTQRQEQERTRNGRGRI